MTDGLKAGFSKTDITPRAGVQLAGFGPFLNRHSIAVRDRLWARAMALSLNGKKLVLVSCDLVGVNPSITAKTRQILQDDEGVDPDSVMVCCTHTHSGPSTDSSFAWGAADEPYVELLPYRIARACKDAVSALEDAVMGYARVPCEGIGLNRVYDRDAPPLEEVLDEGWRPARPELTDTMCRVLTFKTGGALKGFAAVFGCHPVTCCALTRYIHGDYAGVAMNSLERENPGSAGLFLQGASGDVNSCVVHKPEQESLLALDVIAARFANSVREGIGKAEPVRVDSLNSIAEDVVFKRGRVSADELKEELAGYEKVLRREGITDADSELRNAVLHMHALRKFIDKLDSGDGLSPPVRLQVMKLGPVTFFGAPFEVFQAIKNELENKSISRIPALVSHANASLGYAPSNDRIGSGDYADKKVPIIKQSLPLADVHNELVSNFLRMEKKILQGKSA